MKRIDPATPLGQITHRQGVFLLQSVTCPGHYKIGCAGCQTDKDRLAARLDELSKGPTPDSDLKTKRFGPWEPLWIFGFSDLNEDHCARDYLKKAIEDADYKFGPNGELIFVTKDRPADVRKVALSSEAKIRKLRRPWWDFWSPRRPEHSALCPDAGTGS